MTRSAHRVGPGRPAKTDSVPEAETVLQHALKAFADQGYEAVSVRRLSNELGMGHTFISDRYDSKEGLWTAVVEYAAGPWLRAVTAKLEQDGRDDLERLVSAIRALHQAASDSAHFARLIDQEARVDSPRLAHLHGMLAPVNATIKSLFDHLVSDGRLRPMPWYMFYFLTTSPTSLYSQPPLARLMGRSNDADDHDLMTDMVLHGLLADAAE